MEARRRIRDEHGFVLPTRLMVFSISAVALAGLVFVATQGDDSPDVASPAASSPSVSISSKPKPAPTGPAPSPSAKPSSTPTKTAAPPVQRDKTYVVVFNNSNIKGLAGRTASMAQRAGWNVIGSDNWYGTVDASTVYYGPELQAAAAALAKDLGITRTKPAIAPMRPDRLTVILTATYKPT